MRKISLFVFLLVLVVVAGGGIFLATWDIPPPLSKVEKVLPNDKFPR